MVKALPRPPGNRPIDRQYMEQLVRRIELDQPLRPLQPIEIQPAATELRTFDPATATLQETKDFLATVLRDLQGTD